MWTSSFPKCLSWTWESYKTKQENRSRWKKPLIFFSFLQHKQHEVNGDHSTDRCKHSKSREASSIIILRLLILSVCYRWPWGWWSEFVKTESGHEDRVRLQKDGVRPGRQMGRSVMLCYSIYVCVGFPFNQWTPFSLDRPVINLDVSQSSEQTHTSSSEIKVLQIEYSTLALKSPHILIWSS